MPTEIRVDQTRAEPSAVEASSRDKILDTAEALFARRGFEGVGLREVARLSGLSKSALFHHFPTKADLYGAVLARILTAIDASIDDLARAGRPPLAHLIRLVESLIDALAASPTHAPLLLRTLFEAELADGRGAETDRLLDRILSRVGDLLREGVEAGEIRPVSIPHALQTLVGMLIFHFASGEFGDDLLGGPVYSAAEIRRHKQHVVAFIENGLSARAASLEFPPTVEGDPGPVRES